LKEAFAAQVLYCRYK